MSSCGYYSCYKGKPTCKHPERGELNTKVNFDGSYCIRCKRIYGNGIWPSQIPHVDLSGCIQEVIDKDGQVIATLEKNK